MFTTDEKIEKVNSIESDSKLMVLNTENLKVNETHCHVTWYCTYNWLIVPKILIKYSSKMTIKLEIKKLLKL